MKKMTMWKEMKSNKWKKWCENEMKIVMKEEESNNEEIMKI